MYRMNSGKVLVLYLGCACTDLHGPAATIYDKAIKLLKENEEYVEPQHSWLQWKALTSFSKHFQRQYVM